jgi:hypothetical protein
MRMGGGVHRGTAAIYVVPPAFPPAFFAFFALLGLPHACLRRWPLVGGRRSAIGDRRFSHSEHFQTWHTKRVLWGAENGFCAARKWLVRGPENGWCAAPGPARPMAGGDVALGRSRRNQPFCTQKWAILIHAQAEKGFARSRPEKAGRLPESELERWRILKFKNAQDKGRNREFGWGGTMPERQVRGVL